MDKRREGASLVSESILSRQKLRPPLFLISKSVTVYPNLVGCRPGLTLRGVVTPPQDCGFWLGRSEQQRGDRQHSASTIMKRGRQ